MLVNTLIVLGTFIFMEGVAWFTHKYVMHGFLWSWHKSHHKKHDHFLEMNDLFAVVFSIPSILLIYFGYSYQEYSILKYFGIGIFFMEWHMLYFMISLSTEESKLISRLQVHT